MCCNGAMTVPPVDNLPDQRGPLGRARAAVRRAFYRSRRARLAIVAAQWPRVRRRGYDLAHLRVYLDAPIGPVQRDEALFLYALIKVIRPSVVAEIGFLAGQSAFNFLQALDDGAMLYSFDISEKSEAIAADAFGDRSDFRFRRRSQDEITSADVDGRLVDLVFLDASHDLELNQRTFAQLLPLLAPRAIVAVHDTGTWAVDRMLPSHRSVTATEPHGWLSSSEFQHRREERLFMNWIAEEHPEFAQLHLHTLSTLRHGLTLLQRGGRLQTDPARDGESTTAQAAG
jgi:predicted O-methyltransferase YrrM